MARKRFSAEQIINKLRQAEILLAQDKTVVEVCRQLEVTAQTYYRWRKEFGGMQIEQLKRLRELEQENSRLKKIVADQALDNAILREAARGNS